MTSILQVDVSGTPQEWISPARAASLICTDDVAWSTGPIAAVLRGGWSRITERQSRLEIPAIIGTRGQSRINLHDFVPSLTNAKLFERDRYTCAYCAFQGTYKELTREHIKPVGQGGKNTWMNLVAACKPCNNRKGCRTPEEAGMTLLYTPYVPNHFEDFILRRGGGRILADQMDFLLSRVPAQSRLREHLN